MFHLTRDRNNEPIEVKSRFSPSNSLKLSFCYDSIRFRLRYNMNSVIILSVDFTFPLSLISHR